MNGHRDNENQPFEINELELPPLGDDSTEDVEQGAIDALISDYDNDHRLGDMEDGVVLVSEDDIVEDLLASGEVSFLDDDLGADHTPAVGLGDDIDELEGWMDDPDSSPIALDDSYLEDFDLSETHSEMDDGGEGPLEEDYQIDRSGWGELVPVEDDPSDKETTLEVMARLGIELSTEAEDGTTEIDEDHSLRGVLAHHYLGPSKGRVLALAVGTGTKLAVGEGMFQLAADGLLHQVGAASEIEKHIGTSVFTFRGLSYIGTKTGGVLVIAETGTLLGTLNGWVSLGFDDPGQYHDQISMSVQIFGLCRREMLELFVLTQKGQLLVSTDRGLNWSGPALSKKCIAFTANESAGELVLLVEDAGGENPEMYITKDMETFDAVELPKPLVEALKKNSAYPVSLDAAGETIAVAIDTPQEPVYSTIDRGGRWFWEVSPTGVSAIAVDPEATGWLAVAAAGPSSEGSSLRVSEDGGRTWRNVIERIRKENSDTKVGGSERVSELWLEVSACRELYALCDDGVYHIVLPVKHDVH